MTNGPLAEFSVTPVMSAPPGSAWLKSAIPTALSIPSESIRNRPAVSAVGKSPIFVTPKPSRLTDVWLPNATENAPVLPTPGPVPSNKTISASAIFPLGSVGAPERVRASPTSSADSELITGGAIVAALFTRLVRAGDPQPVTGSYPNWAEYPATPGSHGGLGSTVLLPTVMS